MGKTERFLILNKEISRYVKVMSDASDIIHDQDVSNYPIFVAHQQEVAIGIPLVEKDNLGGLWNIHASSLEEFVVKSIIVEDKIEDFKKNYKDPAEFVCVFVLSELGAQFIYLPRK